MNEIHPKPGTEHRDRLVAPLVAGIFSALSLAVFIFEMYTVFVTQTGTFYPGDKIFIPFSLILLGVGLYSSFLIRRGHYELSSWLLFMMVQLPSLALVIVLRDFTTVAGLFLLIASVFLIWLVFPKSSRGPAAMVLTLSVIIVIGIELWNPAFRLRIGDSAGIVTAIHASQRKQRHHRWASTSRTMTASSGVTTAAFSPTSAWPCHAQVSSSYR